MEKPGQKLLRGGGYAAKGNQPKQAVAVAGALAAGLVGLKVIGALCSRVGGREAQSQRRVRWEEQERQRREGRRCRIIVDSTSSPAGLHPPLSTSSSGSSSSEAGVIHIQADCTAAAACAYEPAPWQRLGAACAGQQDADPSSEQRIKALEAQLREARQERGKAGKEASRAREAAADTARAREAAATAESQLLAAMRQLSGLQSRITGLTSEKKAAELGRREAKAQLAAANRQARALQSIVDSLHAQLRADQEGKAAVEAQLRSLLAQQHKQQQGAASVHKVQAEAEMTREEMSEMRRALHTLQEELEAARAARARSDAAHAATQHQLRRLQAETKLYRESNAARARKRGS